MKPKILSFAFLLFIVAFMMSCNSDTSEVTANIVSISSSPQQTDSGDEAIGVTVDYEWNNFNSGIIAMLVAIVDENGDTIPFEQEGEKLTCLAAYIGAKSSPDDKNFPTDYKAGSTLLFPYSVISDSQSDTHYCSVTIILSDLEGNISTLAQVKKMPFEISSKE